MEAEGKPEEDIRKKGRGSEEGQDRKA